MNLLIHDFAAAIEREACDDPDARERFQSRGVTTYGMRAPVERRDAVVPAQPPEPTQAPAR